MLLVDDEEALRHGVGRLLKRLGYEVLEAANGEEAIKCFESHMEAIGLGSVELVCTLQHARSARTPPA